MASYLYRNEIFLLKAKDFFPKGSDFLFDDLKQHLVDNSIKVKNNGFYCTFCKKGPLTGKGILIHLFRKHEGDLLELFDSFISNRVKAMKKGNETWKK